MLVAHLSPAVIPTRYPSYTKMWNIFSPHSMGDWCHVSQGVYVPPVISQWLGGPPMANLTDQGWESPHGRSHSPESSCGAPRSGHSHFWEHCSHFLIGAISHRGTQPPGRWDWLQGNPLGQWNWLRGDHPPSQSPKIIGQNLSCPLTCPLLFGP